MFTLLIIGVNLTKGNRVCAQATSMGSRGFYQKMGYESVNGCGGGFSMYRLNYGRTLFGTDLGICRRSHPFASLTSYYDISGTT